MAVLENLEDLAMRAESTLTRRKFVARFIKVGASLAAAAAAAGIPVKALAGNVACCNLAYYPHFCTYDDCGLSGCSCGCDGGQGCYYWYCSQSGCTYKCGECYCCQCSWIDQLCSPGFPCLSNQPNGDERSPNGLDRAHHACCGVRPTRESLRRINVGCHPATSCRWPQKLVDAAGFIRTGRTASRCVGGSSARKRWIHDPYRSERPLDGSGAGCAGTWPR